MLRCQLLTSSKVFRGKFGNAMEDKEEALPGSINNRDGGTVVPFHTVIDRGATVSSFIPGLPDDIATLCLARIPRVQHRKLGIVCRAWRELFRGKGLLTVRVKERFTDTWLLVLTDELSFYSYDLRSKKRCPLPLPDDQARVNNLHSGGYKCATQGSRFVVLGGVVKDADKFSVRGQATVDIFDVSRSEWSQGADMRVPRCYFASGVIDGKLYVAGGYNGSGDLEVTGEVYNFETDEWSAIPSMPYSLANIESDAVLKGRLFIKGPALSGVEDKRRVLSYDPVRNVWESCERLERNLGDGEFVAAAEDLYVIDRKNSIGKYNKESAKWESLGSISLYYFPFECPSKSKQGICFGRQVFFLNSFAGEVIVPLIRCNMIHQILPKVYWQWQGAILEA